MNDEKDFTERTEFNADQLHELIAELAAKRPLFHSEADFQFALAWLIQQEYKTAKVRLEYPIYIKPLGQNEDPNQKPNSFLDLLVIYENKYYPIELKYKTKFLITEKTTTHEAYHLADDNAGNIGRYDCIKDIYRIEQITKYFKTQEKSCPYGFTIWLTNDTALYKKHDNNEKPKHVYHNFSIGDGRIIKDYPLEWLKEKNGEYVSYDTPPSKYSPRQNSITLKRSYEINWKEYSKTFGKNAKDNQVKRTSKYCLLEI